MGLQVNLYMVAFVTGCLLLVFGCSQSQTNRAPATTEEVKQTTQNNKGLKGDTKLANDEWQFKQFLNVFKTAVKQKNQVQIAVLCHFPLQTAPQWTAEDLRQGTVDKTGGLIGKNEFATYYKDMFPADVIRILPASTEGDLSEIDGRTTENYYQTVAKVTDKGSKVYELQKQYAQDNGQETSFGFVFGKVQGQYKVISYYRPWPLKD